MKKSICKDCKWKDSCQNVLRINEMQDTRNNPGHINQIFEVIILTCSNKDLDRSYNKKNENGDNLEDISPRFLYYCNKCESMHRENSHIGINHRNVIP